MTRISHEYIAHLIVSYSDFGSFSIFYFILLVDLFIGFYSLVGTSNQS